MVITQVTRFLENRDASSVSYRMFSLLPQDTYPAFSICFTGAEFRWYHDETLYDIFGISPAQYTKILKGDVGTKYDYNYDSHLFSAMPLKYDDVSDKNSEDTYLKVSDILYGSEIVTGHTKTTDNYGNQIKQTTERNMPFDIGHQSPDTICFSRKSRDRLGVIRSTDTLKLNYSMLKLVDYKMTEMAVILHYPGQLLRSLDNPRYKTTFEYFDRRKILDLKISNVVVQRKRPDSNIPCNDKIKDEDSYLRHKIVDRVGCIPAYWKSFFMIHGGLKDCNSSIQLEKINRHLENIKDVLDSYDPPCVEMTAIIMSTHDQLTPTREEAIINLVYTERFYQEIENVQDFTFESFWSGVGGFVGIFLGYSLLQFPAFLDSVPMLMKTITSYLQKGKSFLKTN